MATESNISDSDRDGDRDEEDAEDDYLDSSEDEDDITESPAVGSSSQQRGFSDSAQQRPARPSLPPLSLSGSGTASHSFPTGVSRMGIPKIPLLNTPAEAGSRSSPTVVLYELHPVQLGNVIPAGRQIAASVRGSTFTMKELESILAENMRLRLQVEQLEAGSRTQPSTSEQPASQTFEARSSQTVHQALQDRVNEAQAWLETERDRHRTESEQMHGQYNSLREQYDQLLADVRAFATPAATPPPLGTGRGPRTFDAIPLLDDDSSIHDFPTRPHNASLGPRTSTFRVGEVVMNGPTTPHAVTSSPRGDYEDIQPREPGQNGLRVDGRGLGGGDPAGLEHLISALHTLTVNNRAERLASVVQRLCDNDVLLRLERGLGVIADP
ncbi:hypothetical protein WJX73_005099 [Symbiochloris irregularis]|uniref:Uncharacterized protein n=1 Tax=Symbiochloris irregularis TaxID=706552 RepID=A0AAW1P854_9CHLO